MSQGFQVESPMNFGALLGPASWGKIEESFESRKRGYKGNMYISEGSGVCA